MSSPLMVVVASLLVVAVAKHAVLAKASRVLDEPVLHQQVVELVEADTEAIVDDGPQNGGSEARCALAVDQPLHGPQPCGMSYGLLD